MIKDENATSEEVVREASLMLRCEHNKKLL